ncbi:MAG: DUF2971 domain-containing protein [Verrucomicrobiales bacterium]
MNPFAGMSPHEKEMVGRFIAKCDPPPILHRYRGNPKFALKEIVESEVHVAGVNDMNDPFEYRAPLSIDVEKLRSQMQHFASEQLGMGKEAAQAEAAAIDRSHLELLNERVEQLRAASGLICCSRNPRSNRMWAYYGGAHRGICIGYSTKFPPFCLAREVAYSDPEKPIDLLDTLDEDPTLLSDQVSCRKGEEWEFEEEFRIPIGPFSKEHTRLLPIEPEAIVEIRLGTMIDADFRKKVIEAASALPKPPRMIQMGCDRASFQLTETPL